MEERRKAYGITVNELCQTSHISKKTYLAFRRGRYPRMSFDWFLRLMDGFRMILDDEEEFLVLWKGAGGVTFGLTQK